MIIEAQNKEFFLDSPNNIHLSPLTENTNGEYAILSDHHVGSLLLGGYKDKKRANEVYEEIKELILKRKKYYLMPRE